MLVREQSLILGGSTYDRQATKLYKKKKETDNCPHSLLKSEFLQLPFPISGRATRQFLSTKNVFHQFFLASFLLSFHSLSLLPKLV